VPIPRGQDANQSTRRESLQPNSVSFCGSANAVGTEASTPSLGPNGDNNTPTPSGNQHAVDQHSVDTPNSSREWGPSLSVETGHLQDFIQNKRTKRSSVNQHRAVATLDGSNTASPIDIYSNTIEADNSTSVVPTSRSLNPPSPQYSGVAHPLVVGSYEHSISQLDSGVAAESV
jgi:hypothetical protein